MAKPEDRTYQPGKRAMFKVKHARTADCVVAGFRWHKNGHGTLVGSLLLGLYDDNGSAASRRRHVRVHDGDARAVGRASSRRCASTRSTDHPWRDWADADGATETRMPGGQSRWSAGKDLSWEPLRIERVCEVKYDHMQGDRFRHARDLSSLAARQAARRLPLRLSSRSRRLSSWRRCLVQVDPVEVQTLQKKVML